MQNPCPTVCNADLRLDLMSSVSTIDFTNVIDRTCNQVLFVTDDPGLNIASDAASGAWLSTTSPRTRVVASMSEIRAHFAPGSETYKAAAAFFTNRNSGVAGYFVIGLWDKAGGESVATALDLIAECQPCFLHVAFVHYDSAGAQIMDTTSMEVAADWAQLNGRMAYFLSIDAATEDPSDATSLKAKLAALGMENSYVHYSRGRCETVLDPLTGLALTYANGLPVLDAYGDPVLDGNGDPVISDGTAPIIQIRYGYLEFLTAGWAANVDFTQRNSGYVIAYKPQGGNGFVGELPDIMDNGTVTAISGAYPSGGFNPVNNGYANVYVQVGGSPVLYPGVMVTGAWLDDVHLKLFLRRAMQDALANAFIQARRIPYDNARGRALIVNALDGVLRSAQANGLFSGDVQNWEMTGDYLRRGTAYVIRGGSFTEQLQSRKSQRLAPQFEVCFVSAGGTIHVPLTLCTEATQAAA